MRPIRSASKLSAKLMPDSIVGVWRLLSYESRKPDGITALPYGGKASGYLIYTAEGFMSVTIVGDGRSTFADPDRFAGTPAEYSRGMKSYVSYAGRYTASATHVVHHIELSQFPNWSGTDEVRYFEIEGTSMRMQTPPFILGGVEQTAHLLWHRANEILP